MLKMPRFNRWNGLLFLILFALLPANDIYAQRSDINHRELSVIHLQAKDILSRYEEIINRIGESIVNDPKQVEGLIDQFLELAGQKSMLFNDLDPDYNLSAYFESETYISNLVNWYPDGIEIDLDLENLRVGDILTHGSNSYSLDLKVDKQILGNYMNRQFNTHRESLLFKVGFTKSGNEFRNFRIVGIQSFTSELVPNYEQSIEELNAQSLKQNDNLAVKQGIESLINDYSNYLSLIGNAEETDFDKVSYAKSFKNLFEFENITIFNDLEPEPQNLFLYMDDYLDILRIHYPAGIDRLSITMDTIIFSNVIVEENKGYSVYVGIDKIFSGTYDNQNVFTRIFPLTVKVSFEKIDKVFKNFRIRSINLEAEKFIKADSDFKVPVQTINPVSRKGLSVVVFGSYGQTKIEDQNLMDLNMETDNYNWSITPGYGINLGFGIMASVSDHIGFETGGFFNQYSTTFSLAGSFDDSKLSVDVNGDSFIKRMKTNYDSTVKYNLISIPLTFTYTSSKPGNLGIYLSLGGLFSYCHSGEYDATGSWKYSGYYPEEPVYGMELTIEQLGYYDRKNINESGKLGGGQLNFSARASLGVSIPVKYFTQVRIGPEVEWGLYDFNPDGGTIYNIFGQSNAHQPTYLYRFGVRLGLVFKL